MLFPGRQIVLSERPVPADVGLVGSSFRLQSCMLAEDGYLLDNITYIEIESFLRFGGHSTALAGLRAFNLLEKQMHYFIACKLLACRVLFIPGGTKRLIARNK